MSRSNPEQEVAPLYGEEEQAFLTDLADELLGMLEDAEKAIKTKLDAQMFDQDEYLALWGLLPAKVRTAIKRAGETQATCAECGVAGSHTRHCSVGGRFA